MKQLEKRAVDCLALHIQHIYGWSLEPVGSIISIDPYGNVYDAVSLPLFAASGGFWPQTSAIRANWICRDLVPITYAQNTQHGASE